MYAGAVSVSLYAPLEPEAALTCLQSKSLVTPGAETGLTCHSDRQGPRSSLSPGF